MIRQAKPTRRTAVRKKRKGPPRRGPERDAKYLKWIRGMACLICWPGGQSTRTEAAHIGERGLGQKCSDYETVPLCAVHHRTGSVSHHVLGAGFWAYHGIDKDAVIAELQRLWSERVESREK